MCWKVRGREHQVHAFLGGCWLFNVLDILVWLGCLVLFYLGLSIKPLTLAFIMLAAELDLPPSYWGSLRTKSLGSSSFYKFGCPFGVVKTLGKWDVEVEPFPISCVLKIKGLGCCCCLVASVVPDSVQPHMWQPPSPCPWDSPGKNIRVGCHFLLQCMKVKVKLLSHVWLFATPWTAAHQAPPFMGFSRQECWSGCHWLLRRSWLSHSNSWNVGHKWAYDQWEGHGANKWFQVFLNTVCACAGGRGAWQNSVLVIVILRSLRTETGKWMLTKEPSCVKITPIASK